MSAITFIMPNRPATDSNGKSIPGAQMWFTLTETNTPAAVYSDSGLTTPRTNPVVANGVGSFSDIFIDSSVTYRVRIYSADAEVGVDDPLEEHDPYTGPLAAIDIQEAVASTALSAAEADASADEAAASVLSAGLYAAAAATSIGDLYANTADALSKGVASTASLVAGSGGTNGTFDVAFSGGAGTGAAARFVVAGGALTQITITAKGRGYTSAPTMSFAASTGLTGASATAVIANNTDDGEYFLIVGTDSIYADLYKNVAGVATSQNLALPSLAGLEALGYRYSFSNSPTTLTDAAYNTDRSTHIETSPFARAVFTTAATRIRIHGYTDSYSTFPAAHYAELGLLVNGEYTQAIEASGDGYFATEVTLASGTKTLEIVNGLQSKPSSLLGSYLVSVEANSPIAQTTPTAANRTVFLVNSIGVGANSNYPTRNSYIAHLRGATDDSIVVYGWGYNSLNAIAGDATKRTALVDILTDLAPTRIVNTLGTNDYGLDISSAATFETAYTALNDAIHAALPSATIYAVTPILRSSEVANAFGSTLGAFRTAISNSASGRAWVTVVDGTAFMTTNALHDGVHPGDYGQWLWARGIDGLLGYTVPQPEFMAGPDGYGSVGTLSSGALRASKTAGGAAFNCGFFSEAHTGDFRYSLSPVALQDTMIGVMNGDPTASSGYADIDWALYLGGGGTVAEYDSGVDGGGIDTYIAGDVFWIDRTGSTVTFKKGATYAGGSTLKTETLAGTIYLDLSMFTVNAQMDITLPA